MKDNAIELFKKILKDNSLSLTAARQTVFEALWNNPPQTMAEIEKKIKDKIDRASLYRNITIFEKLGFIEHITIGWKYKIELSDIFTDHHHHISCLGCGRIIAIHEDKTIEDLVDCISKRYNFKPTKHQFEIQGYCEKCQKNR